MIKQHRPPRSGPMRPGTPRAHTGLRWLGGPSGSQGAWAVGGSPLCQSCLTSSQITGVGAPPVCLGFPTP